MGMGLGNHEPGRMDIYIYTFFSRFGELVMFSILFNGLEPLKLLATKIQKWNSDIYQVYRMIDQVIEDLKHFRRNVDHKFDH